MVLMVKMMEIIQLLMIVVMVTMMVIALLLIITKFINSVFITYEFKLVLIKQFLRYRNGNNSCQKRYAGLCLAL